MVKKTEIKRNGKIFVLDTNILLHDPMSLFRFGGHDVIIPITVIGELDDQKNRNDLVGANAREVTRQLVELVAKDPEAIYSKGISLGNDKGKIKIYFLKELNVEVRKAFKDDIPDHRIISVALNLNNEKKQQKNIILVSNDANLRFKAGSLGLKTQVYQNDRVENIDELYTGITHIDINLELLDVNKFYKEKEADIDALEKHLKRSLYPNEFFIFNSDETKQSVMARFDSEKEKLVMANEKTIYGTVEAKNVEQKMIISAILDPNVSLVTILGKAGTGKTLLAIGVAISLMKNFDQVFISRPAIELDGKDGGALPGDAREKIAPYMQPLYDNIAVLKNQNGKNTKKAESIEKALKEDKITVEPLAFIRGRSLPNTLFIVDESQNLSPQNMKTLTTRMGEGSKIIFTGDIHQIDNAYLDIQSNGLTYLVDKAKVAPHCAHIILNKGERSPLADWAAENL